jgi:hypothetical protein
MRPALAPVTKELCGQVAGAGTKVGRFCVAAYTGDPLTNFQPATAVRFCASASAAVVGWAGS